LAEFENILIIGDDFETNNEQAKIILNLTIFAQGLWLNLLAFW